MILPTTSPDILYFDSGAGPGTSGPFFNVYERLAMVDWSRGQAGTGELDLILGGMFRQEYFIQGLAESWEMPAVGTYVFHIKKGIHYAVNGDNAASRLVNGREVTADDVVSPLNGYVPNACLL